MADDKPQQMTRRAFLKTGLAAGGAAVTAGAGIWGAAEWNASSDLDKQAKQALREHNFQEHFNLRREQAPHDQRLGYAFGVSALGVTSMVSSAALMIHDQWNGPN